ITQLKEEASRVRRQFRGNLGRLINGKRNQWVDGIVEKVIKKQKIQPGEFSKVFARLSRHPVWGIPILLMVVAVMYFSVVNVANRITAWMGSLFWVPLANQINKLIPSGFWNDFLIGEYGILTFGISNALLTVLPILSVFFIVFNILEDIGYLPNLCVLTKRIFEKIGLSGNAIMSITLAFGCKTMATLTTKSLRSKKERYIAVYLIAFAIPCAAQIGLNMSILGRMGLRAFMITFSVAGFIWILVGLLLNKIIKGEQKSEFLQELPAIRLPNPKAVVKKTYYRMLWFLKEALPIFILAAVTLFAADKTGLLGALKNILRPIIIGFLGFPIQMVDALILSMAKHEVAAGIIIKLVQRSQLNYIQTIVAITITMMFIPCLANIMAIIKELNIKRALLMIIIINITAILVAGILNHILLAVIKL
ncbi:MAG: ferrous iron transporter B, partial [Candidatus Omnitrophota bacterium]